tara:strand:+ start:612 stop:1025 length:414 start_codon:yes stop_codon:yes gene_type:complete
MIQVVGAVLIKNSNIIMCRRSPSLKNFPNLFEFPGGKIEKNETKKEALKRELREELNINVNIDNIQEFEHNESNHTIENDGRQINLTLFIIKKWDGEIKIKDGIHSEIININIKNLYNVSDIIPGDSSFFPYIINNL